MPRKSKQQKREHVKVGGVSLPLWRHAKGWRFSWKDAQGKWKYGTRKSRKDAVAAATAQAVLIQKDTMDLGEIDAQTTAIVRRSIAMKITHADLYRIEQLRAYDSTVSDVIECFLAAKAAAAGDSKRNLDTLRSRCNFLLEAFGDEKMIDVTAAQIEDWFNAGNRKPRTRKNMRQVAVTVWRWARLRDMLPDVRTAADKSERPIVARAVPLTWSPEELTLLFEACPESHRNWLALGAFAGLRLSEMYRTGTDGKDVVRCSDVDLVRLVIVVRAEVSKTNVRRIVPILPALERCLVVADNAEPLCGGISPNQPGSKKATIMGEIGKVAGGWRKNALRHSFISYRAAIVGIAQAAQEAGNSETEARRSYQDAKSVAEAEEWFSVNF